MDTELRERIVIDGAEAATSKLTAIAGAAGRVAGAFAGIGGVASALGGIAGVIGVVDTIRGLDRTYQALIRVRDATGMAAGNAHAMFNMFDLSGIGLESAETIITSMARQSQKFASGLAAGSTQGMAMAAMMRKLGISVKDGPEARIIAMSKAAADGKLGIHQLTSAFAIPRGQAAAMMTMLRQGPEKLKEIQKSTISSAAVIDDRTLETYEKMLQARRELANAWGDLVNILYKNLIPAVTEILKSIKQRFDEIGPTVEKIGKGLAAHMGLVVALTKTYLALLIASKAINLFSAQPMGIIARGRQVGGAVMGAMSGRAAAAGSMDFFAAKAANPGIGMFANAGGPLIRIFGSLAGRLGVIGLIIGVVAAAFTLLKDNVLGIRTAFSTVFSRIATVFKDVIDKVVKVFGLLMSALKPILAILGGALLLVLLGLAGVVELLGHVINAVMIGIIALLNGVIWLVNKALPDRYELDYLDMERAKETAKQTERKPGAERPSTYQDFRGSKFEITNNFPPGIDGGRVAVVFGDELAALGERRLDSGVRPVFSYR